MMADERHEFLANNIASMGDVSDRKAVTRSIEASPDVRDFLDDTKYVAFFHCFVLIVVCFVIVQSCF